MSKNIFDSVSTKQALTSKGLDYFKAFNEAYKTDDFLSYSEAAPFDLKQIEKWLAIRKDFTYTESSGKQFFMKQAYTFAYLLISPIFQPPAAIYLHNPKCHKILESRYKRIIQ